MEKEARSPLVSVVVPVYNVERYLRECLDSVLAQTYANIEVILVDDGSGDSSGDICRGYAEKDPRFRVYSKPNGGASSARNYGLDKASGDYIYFLDSDDMLVPDAVGKMVALALETGADLVFFEARTLDENGGLTTGQYDYHRQYAPGAPYKMMEEMAEHKEFHVGTPLYFTKKELFDKHRLRFREGIISEDMIMAYKVFSLAERGAHIHEYLYVRRSRPDSVTTSALTEKNYVSAAAVYREVTAFLKTLPPEKQTTGHVVRCASLVLGVYRRLPSGAREKYKDDYAAITSDILANGAFGDRALALDCRSRLLWGAYKLKKKIFK